MYSFWELHELTLSSALFISSQHSIRHISLGRWVDVNLSLTHQVCHFLTLDIILILYCCSQKSLGFTLIDSNDCLFCHYSVSSAWTGENLKKLLAAMKTNIQKQDTEYPYTKGLKAMDWTKVAFPPFSPEECQEKWGVIFQKVGHRLTWLSLVKKKTLKRKEFLLYVALQYSGSTDMRKTFLHLFFLLRCARLEP